MFKMPVFEPKLNFKVSRFQVSKGALVGFVIRPVKDMLVV